MDVIWHGPVFERSGYASLARSTITGLRDRGVPVGLAEPEVDPLVVRDLLGSHEALASWSRLLTDRVDGDGRDRLAIVCRPPLAPDGHDTLARARRIGPPCRAHVAMTMLEADRIPEAWVVALDAMDRIWVPSHFVVDAFTRSGVPEERIDVVHPGVATDLFSPEPDGFDRRDALARLGVADPRAVVVAAVFEWRRRKGWDVLLDAWAAAFTAADDVVLVVRASPPYGDLGPSVRARIAAHLRTRGHDPNRLAPIQVIDRALTDAELVALYRTADAVALLARGEGFGLPALEAMACGTPVIATAWSGLTDYVDDANGFPVGIDGLDPIGPDAHPPYEPSMRWARPSVAHAALALQAVADHPAEAARRGSRARADVEAGWTLSHAADRTLAACERALMSPPRAHVRPLPAPAASRWVGPLHGISGAAAEARLLLAGLERAGHQATALHLRMGSSDAQVTPATQRHLERLLAADSHVGSGSVVVVAAPLSSLTGSLLERGCVLRTATPFEELDAATRRAVASAAEVWVPTIFHRERLVAAGVSDDCVVALPTPLAETFHPDSAPRERSTFTFLSAGPWHPSVGWDALVRAFALELGSADDVSLVLHVPGAAEAAIRALVATEIDAATRMPDRRRSLLERIRIHTRPIPEAEVPHLLRSADAFVRLGRAEGRARTVLEAAACDLPIITTAWGGQSDVADASTATLVAHELVRPDLAEEILDVWAEPSIDDARVALRVVADGDGVVDRRRRAMAARLRARPGPDEIASVVARRLDELRSDE